MSARKKWGSDRRKFFAAGRASHTKNDSHRSTLASCLKTSVSASEKRISVAILSGRNRAGNAPRPTTTMAAESKLHRPRTRNGGSRQENLRSTDGSAVVEGSKGSLQPAFPLAAVLWPARVGVSSWVVLSLILMGASLFRWAVGFWGYSGTAWPCIRNDMRC